MIHNFPFSIYKNGNPIIFYVNKFHTFLCIETTKKQRQTNCYKQFFTIEPFYLVKIQVVQFNIPPLRATSL